MKRKLKRGMSTALACVMLLALLPAGALAATAEEGNDTAELVTPEWEISKSKTATELDDNYKSQVTLSLPAAEEQLVSDVVFVLDESSCSEPVKEEVAQMLENLYQQVKDTNAAIKIGAVQFRGEVTELPLKALNEKTKTAITQFMGARPETGGSNMSAGLLAGEKMLDADTAVDGSRKYLILVSDGITYIWDAADTEAQENYGVNFSISDTPDNPMLASPDGWDVKYGRGYVPTDWSDQLGEIEELLEKTIVEKASVYVRKPDISMDPFVRYPEKDSYASTVDIALYQSYKAYQSIAAKYHAYSVMTGVESEMEAYPFGPSFMNYLAGGEEVSFDDIQNDIYFLLDAGSEVVDVIGEGTHDGSKYYNFDFVDPDSLTLTRGVDENGEPAPLEKAKIDDTTYGFGERSDNGSYEFVLHYYANGTSEVAGEHFVWNINVPITIDKPVQLTYTVQLTNPQTAPGTYGVYDRDGSKGYTGLYTNNSATLYPVDSTGCEVVPEEFPKPTVSYTVQPTGTLTVTKYVADNEAVVDQEYTFTATIGDQAQTFRLGNGQTMTFTDLALGTIYSIVETNANGYKTTYYNQCGEITKDNPDVAAAVINVPVDEGALVISKTVNNGDLNKEFTFTVTLKDTEDIGLAGTYAYTGSKTGTITNGGSVTLKNGESISINNLPEGTTYTVTETAEDGYTTTVSGHDATVPYAGSTATGQIAAGTAAVVHYTNTYQYTPVIPNPPVIPVEPSKPELNLENHVAYIIGYPVDYMTGAPTDDMSRWPVKPQGNITRAEVATIFFRLLTDESRAHYWSQANPYSDVGTGNWFNNAISTLSNAGIITGYPDGTFCPNAPITRAEFAAIAARFSEVIYNGGNSFTDVPENHWAARYIALAEYLGWINGYPDGTFKPEQSITRAESMTLINRVLERDVEEEHMLEDMVKWPDNRPGTWYYEAVQEATNSHEYVRTDKLVPEHDFNYEDWQEILEAPDWAALEKAWSTANSK